VHFHRCPGIGVLGAVNQVCPINQLVKLGGLEAELPLAGFDNKLGARAIIRPVEFLPAPVMAKMFRVGFAEESALVVVEPPGEPLEYLKSTMAFS
jgi:hypothetical protein